MTIQQMDSRRLTPNAGIAIGPILFIIAILAILAAAIAAGSGSFTAGTSAESDKTKAGSLIQIGDNLKIGMDNIIMSGGQSTATIITDPTATAAATDLFSPTGGGIASPSVGMANAPTDIWYYPSGLIQGLGTGGTNYDYLAVLSVSATVCAQINSLVQGMPLTSATPATAAVGVLAATASPVGGANTGSGAASVTGSTTWPYPGVQTGCVLSTGDTAATGHSSKYFFYQVIVIQ